MKKFSATQIAISGLLLALNIAALLLASFIPTIDMTMQSFAGAIVYFAYVRFSPRIAIMIYAGSVILGLIVVPDKVGLLFYILFVGLYALLKPVVEEFAAKRVGGTVNDPVIRPFGRKGLRVVKRRRLVIAVAYMFKTVIAAVLVALVLIITIVITGVKDDIFIWSSVALVIAFYLYDYILWLVVEVLRKR
jgi:hypothetical protein